MYICGPENISTRLTRIFLSATKLVDIVVYQIINFYSPTIWIYAKEISSGAELNSVVIS